LPLSVANPRNAARAIDALRRGWPVRIEGEEGALTLLAVETVSDNAIAQAGGAESILLSPARAATLKLANQLAAADVAQPVRVKAAAPLDAATAMAIADPSLDLAYPLKGPFVCVELGAPDSAAGALQLARLAGLLPAFLVVPASGNDIAVTSLADIAGYTDAEMLKISARARLPVAAAEDAELVAFRSSADATDHLALIIGQRDGSAPVVRLHSECLTGDVLGSLKCDCGPQLHEALHQIADAKWGVLLYLRQEGRGIGLVNKLRAYALQDQGFDTVDANLRLGFAVDARDFAVAAQMLALLSINHVRLLTNNPDKVAGLEAAGIGVAERLPLAIQPNRYNKAYLETKRDRTGHRL
jgi:GTP cyclohydrolase II